MNRPRREDIDLMKGVAILAVVGIHSLGRFIDDPASATVITGPLRFCIPVFLYCAGTLFISVRDFPGLWRRYRRILLPYVPMAILAQIAMRISNGQPTLFEKPLFGLQRLLLAQDWNIYYFIWVIAILYAIGYSIRDVRRSLAIGILIFSFALAMIHFQLKMDLFDRFMITDEVRSVYECRYVAFWACFFVLGLYSTRLGTERFFANTSNAGGAAAVVLAAIVAIYQSHHVSGDPYDSPLVLLFGVACIWAMSGRKCPTAFQYLSECSFGIYLIHLFIVYAALFAVSKGKIDAKAWMGIPVFLLAVGVPVLIEIVTRRIKSMQPLRFWLGF